MLVVWACLEWPILMHLQGIKRAANSWNGFPNVPLLLFILLQFFTECSQCKDQVTSRDKGAKNWLVINYKKNLLLRDYSFNDYTQVKISCQFCYSLTTSTLFR